MPAAEVEITAELVRRLLRAQHPDLAGLPVEPLANGWHPANILIRDGRVSGVIDFGDITAGDPASDLSLVWMLLPAASHEAFRAAYAAASNGAISAGTWARGRGWALNLAIVFLAWSADSPSCTRSASELWSPSSALLPDRIQKPAEHAL